MRCHGRVRRWHSFGVTTLDSMPWRCYTEVVRVPWERARARYGSSFTTFGFATRLVISAALILFLADLVDQIVSAEGVERAKPSIVLSLVGWFVVLIIRGLWVPSDSYLRKGQEEARLERRVARRLREETRDDGAADGDPRWTDGRGLPTRW